MTNYPENGRELVFLGPLKESWGFANLFTTRQHKNVGQRDFSCNMGRLKLAVVFNITLMELKVLLEYRFTVIGDWSESSWLQFYSIL